MLHPCHRTVGDTLAPRLLALVKRHTHKNDTVGSETTVHPPYLSDVLTAVRTPRRPEINHHILTTQRTERRTVVRGT